MELAASDRDLDSANKIGKAVHRIKPARISIDH